VEPGGDQRVRPGLSCRLHESLHAIYKLDPKLVPQLALDYRMTKNTGHIDVGEGALRNRDEPTTFNLIAADPVQGEVSLQARVGFGNRLLTTPGRR
jgi:hypothetical protein